MVFWADLVACVFADILVPPGLGIPGDSKPTLLLLTALNNFCTALFTDSLSRRLSKGKPCINLSLLSISNSSMALLPMTHAIVSTVANSVTTASSLTWYGQLFFSILFSGLRGNILSFPCRVACCQLYLLTHFLSIGCSVAGWFARCRPLSGRPS